MELRRTLEQTDTLYYRLALLVGAPRTGKTTVLRQLQMQQDWPRLNVNLALCARLLELTRRQRALRVPRILAELVDELDGTVVILDNIEVLFDPALSQDPLRLLQGLARNQKVLAAWPGSYDGVYLTYAEPGHREARRYRSPEALVVTTTEPILPAISGSELGTAAAGQIERT